MLSGCGLLQLQMSRLEQLCVQYLESCIGVRNVLVALQNAAKLGLDFVRVSSFNTVQFSSVTEFMFHAVL